MGHTEVVRIAVVEDDPSIGRRVRDALESNGYHATWYATGVSATAALEASPPQLVLLDVGLPDIDGFSLCRWLRRTYPDLPVVLVTARDAEIDIIVGLDAGASDYVTKPFSMNVLLARIRAHLRKVVDPTAAPVVVGALRVDVAAYTASIADRPVELRPKEFELLRYLASNAGRVLTRERLLADVWDLHWESSSKTLEMHIHALRRKLGDAVEIATIRGVGYRLEAA